MFTFKLEKQDGTPAEPAALHTAVPNWSPGDTISLRGRWALRARALKRRLSLDSQSALSSRRMAQSNRKLLDVERKYGMWQLKQPLRPTRYYFGTETKPYRSLGKREYVKALELQAREAVKVHSHNGKTWWWFRKQVYVDRDNLTSQDVTALALQMQRAKDEALEVAHAEMRGEEAVEAAGRRQPMPEHVRHEVWRRDQGRCVDCGSRERLEFDHIIPISKGGSNTARNIELRCEPCNRRKAAEI
jgi:HNH endonuclease